MALSDTREFLEGLFLQYDPSADLADGSRIQTELIEPILARVGIDPIDEEMGTFLLNRLRQAFPDLALTEIDEHVDLLVDPMRVLLEPIVREIKLIRLRSSIANAERMSDEETDALLANFFVVRDAGDKARGVVRAYFSSPQPVSVTMLNTATSRGGLRFFPETPQAITADQMLFNVDGSEYYFDINYVAENAGDAYNLEPGDIRAISNLPAAVRVTNLRRFRDGVARETTPEFVARAGSATTNRTLTVAPGIDRLLRSSFPGIAQLAVVGFRDPEMTRDVIRGGGLGPIPDDDIYGAFYGQGVPVDDLDLDVTTPLLNMPGAALNGRVAANGEDPASWYVSLSYSDGPTLVVRDVRIAEVVSNTQVRLENHEIPLSVSTVVWSLRQRKITISDIPGGITLPDAADGSLELRDDEVHVGGRTDFYVAGEVEDGSAVIASVSDERPFSRGRDARTTAGSTTVTLFDAVRMPEVGMSLVLERGLDVGSYRVVEVLGGNQVVLDVAMTGTQVSLSWRLVDEIDVELTDPKQIRIEGTDAIVSAGGSTVITASAINFVEANVQEGDTLELLNSESVGGEYTVTSVAATSLQVSPTFPRSVSSVAFRIFRRFEPVQVPIVRVKSFEILDSADAPSGSIIPHRDPVLLLSGGFGNESAGFHFDGRVILGLVLGGVPVGGGYNISTFNSVNWYVYDSSGPWAGPLNSGLLLLPTGTVTPSAVAAAINGDFDLNTAGVSAQVITFEGMEYVAITSEDRNYIVLGDGSVFDDTSGSGNRLGVPQGVSSSSVRGLSLEFQRTTIRSGDLIEVYDGYNAVTQTRAATRLVNDSTPTVVLTSSGPTSPGNMVHPVMFDPTVFNPEVGARARFARPSVGRIRTYFLNPTSVEFDYAVTRFTDGAVVFRPDPENTRVVLPPPPDEVLPGGHPTSVVVPASLTDPNASFVTDSGVRAGDLLDLLYVAVVGTSALPTPAPIAVAGLTLVLSLREAPAVTISFPTSMTRTEIVEYINLQLGENVASIADTGALQLMPENGSLSISDTSTALSVLFLSLAPRTNAHPYAGTYVIASVSETVLGLSNMGVGISGSTARTQYRVRRHLQRISSTEMRDNLDASGLYYADVEAVAVAPGDQHNIPSDVTLDVTGHRGDGFRLRTENSALSYSRAEVLYAELSRTILLPGSNDSPAAYVQLSQQNVRVTYDRSELVDAIQSFVDSDFNRDVLEDVLVRHLLPNYVLLNWVYAGGSNETAMVAALEDYLSQVEPRDRLELPLLAKVLTARGATSLYVPDAETSSGRRALEYLALWHDADRRVRGALVKESALPSRLGRWIPDTIRLRRLSASGLR